MGTKSGVYPVYENQFQVGATKEALTDIADMESFSVKLDNGVEEWNPLDQKGWVRRLMTSKYNFNFWKKKFWRYRKRLCSRISIKKWQRCRRMFTMDIPRWCKISI